MSVPNTPTMALNATPTIMSDDSPLPSPPFTRGSSPSPSISPTPALLACPPLGRCFSASSTVSSVSGHSSASRSSSVGTAVRRRGYVRPQGSTFAESARSRDSVMSLGSIAHLQYYFARTGMLDGKGGQLAKDSSITRKASMNLALPTVESRDLTEAQSMGHLGNDFVNSPIEEEDISGEWDTSIMLPPTVSTYSHRTRYIPPPPDGATLRKDLQDGLVRVTQALDEARSHRKQRSDPNANDPSTKSLDLTNTLNKPDLPKPPSPCQAWHELEGMHILDVTTLAIRSAKLYYTMHESPTRLSLIKPERVVREELLSVLDCLKRSAARNFTGGLKTEELDTISTWVGSVTDFLAKEQIIEQREATDREKWVWLEGQWKEGDRKREWLFLSSFLEPAETLPTWTEPTAADTLPTPFLEALRNGLLLVRLHNRILKSSKRQFGDIKAFHTDTAKPYRAAENLRYWLKAAEIRWETKLTVDVLGVVYGKGVQVWRDFEAAVWKWSVVVREEITREWKQGSVRVPLVVPEAC